MANLNRVLLIGNATRDPDVKYLPKGTAVGTLGVAVNRVWSGDDGEKKEEVTFIDVKLWGRHAEIAEKYIKKGKPVMIEGRLTLESWDDKQTGQKRTKLLVTCENLQLLGSREEQAEPHSRSQEKQQPKARPARPPKDPDLDVEPDSDIPF